MVGRKARSTSNAMEWHICACCFVGIMHVITCTMVKKETHTIGISIKVCI